MRSIAYRRKCMHAAANHWKLDQAGRWLPKRGAAEPRKDLASVLGIRLEQLAAEHDDLASFLAKVGISPGTYYLLIKGDANPTLDTLELIAKGLGLSVWELLGLNDGVVKKALEARDIDLEAIKASSRARVEALAQLESQRVEFKKKSTGQSERHAIGNRCFKERRSEDRSDQFGILLERLRGRDQSTCDQLSKIVLDAHGRVLELSPNALHAATEETRARLRWEPRNSSGWIASIP